mmetsp:Transcript_1461/g.160  ORF Transcript_1461/g.160 Transcript_1461/m.160 type:complete len:88 (+) Transcript_1461:374-637(+)
MVYKSNLTNFKKIHHIYLIILYFQEGMWPLPNLKFKYKTLLKIQLHLNFSSLIFFVPLFFPYLNQEVDNSDMKIQIYQQTLIPQVQI